MTNRQLLEKYSKERAALTAQRAALDTRVQALDGVIGGLRVLLGERPAPTPRRGGASSASGTAALLLDVLSDGQPRSRADIAAIAKVSPASAAKHLAALVATGDVVQRGKSRATTYQVE